MADDQAPKENAKKRIDDQVLLGLILAGILALLIFLNWFLTDRFEIRSECKNIDGGVSCLVTHTSKKPREISVCTDIKRVCTNGLPSSAKGCFNGLLPPGSSGRLLVANSEFSNSSNCKVAAQTESVEVLSKATGTPEPKG